MKVTAWNMQDFFVFIDNYNNEDLLSISEEDWQKLSSSSTKRNKHIQKIEDCASVIKDIDSDVYILSEVGGYESISNLNKFFLNSEYLCFESKGNSKRCIDIIFMVKKNIKYSLELICNKNLILDNGKKFSRNIGELRLSLHGKLKLILLGVHLKAKRDSKGDFKSIDQRSSELKSLSNHILNLKQEHNVPVVVGGDFNCLIEEYDLQLFSKKFKEIHQEKNSTINERYSFVYFSTKRWLQQLDYFFYTEDLIVDKKQSFTYRFKNEYGYEIDIPISIKEKYNMISDHNPIVLKIKLTD